MPSLPPKPLRKRAHAATTVLPKLACEKTSMNNTISMGLCEQCCCQGIKCVPTNGGARCVNCKAKHYWCLLVPAKDSLEGKGVSIRTCHTKSAVGAQMKAQEKKWQKKADVLHRITPGMFPILLKALDDLLKSVFRSRLQ